MMKHTFICLAVLLTVVARDSFAQQHYFIDGYHGGKYGHYPSGYTGYIVEQLKANPFWKINLEIEPETWEVARVQEPEAYATLKKIFADQSDAGRIEYVNPGYGQSYLYTSSGESMIRQFSYGIKEIKKHFPEAVFTSYSSEEPCFTSALPQVLLSFGFKYASLKNPNTCWGGYTRAFGGELVQWEGPDGSKLPTVTRYESEALLEKSTWQTTAWNNSPEYIQSALAAGIKQPIGMCLQDAGWRVGPWLKERGRYETWRNYMGHIVDTQHTTVWKLSQEDIQVSLVWGSQALQRIAQQVRAAENKLAAAEKYAAMSALRYEQPWPQKLLDTAWKSLLLAQHHDCWIVPYNGNKGDTWIDKVKHWTDMTLAVSDSILHQHERIGTAFQVVNTTPGLRNEWVVIPNYKGGPVRVFDYWGIPVPAYCQRDGSLIFKASVPPMGYSSYSLDGISKEASFTKHWRKLRNGRYQIESNMYKMEIDPARGGVITSLVARVAKDLDRRELVDLKHSRGFNELRGYFYKESAWRSSMDKPAVVRIKEDNPAQIVVEINGTIAGHPFTQWITLINNSKRIDMRVKIDWKGEPGIGAPQVAHFKPEDRYKSFYNDSFKLQVLFPLNLSEQRLSKDAPYDITESNLSNTFFNTWDSIKNNVMLHWAEVTDCRTSVALFSDHTTSYVHGEQYPLGFTLQYAGTALWGRNYSVDGPTDVRYALLPHDWMDGCLNMEIERWCEPLLITPANDDRNLSLLGLQDARWQVPAMMMDGKDLLIRIYNAAGDSRERELTISGSVEAVTLEELNGRTIEELGFEEVARHTIIRLSIPRSGIRTIRLKNIKVQY